MDRQWDSNATDNPSAHWQTNVPVRSTEDAPKKIYSLPLRECTGSCSTIGMICPSTTKQQYTIELESHLSEHSGTECVQNIQIYEVISYCRFLSDILALQLQV